MNGEFAKDERPEGLFVGAINKPPLSLGRRWRLLLSSSLLRNVIETYATRVLLMGVSLVTTIVVARLLGPGGRGLYAVAVATSAVGVQLGQLGLHTANVHFAARDPHLLPGLFGNTLVVSLGLGSLVSTALAIVAIILPQAIPIHGVLLIFTLVGMPLGIAYLLTQDLMLGLHDVRGYNLVEVVNKSVPVALMICIVVAQRVSVASLFATTLAALFVGLLWSVRRLQASLQGWPAPSLPLFRETIHYALRAYLVALFAFMVLRADLFMVQKMLGAEQTGYYSIASSMADVVTTLAVVVGTVLLPQLSSLSDVEAKRRLTCKVMYGMGTVLFLLLLVACVLAKPAVRVLFGNVFEPSAVAFVLLAPGILFVGMQAVVMQFLNSIGCPKTVVLIWGFCILFNIASNLWAIPRFGIAGAAIVCSMTYFIAFALQLWATGKAN
jgi:O-antigen/teichoic acid export membrane protein